MNLQQITSEDAAELLRAARRDDTETLTRLIANLAEAHSVTRGDILLSCSSADGTTVLHEAASYDSTEILNIVLDRATWGDTPSYRLAFLAQKDADGNQAVHIASNIGHITFLTNLVEDGASIDTPNRACLTPLLVAVSACISTINRELKTRLLDTIKYLLSQNVNINATSATGDTALHLAVREEDATVVRLLLNTGAKVNVRVAADAPLHVAVRLGRPWLVRLLLDFGADPNMRDTRGGTALHGALRAEDTSFVVDIVSALIAHGASTTA